MAKTEGKKPPTKKVTKKTSKRDFEVVSIAEVYEKKKANGNGDNRGRRVCGKIVKGNGRCVNIAGRGSQHFGVGYCSVHEGTPEEEHLFNWEAVRISSVVSMGTLAGGITVTDEEMYDMTKEVAILNGMLSLQLSRHGAVAVDNGTVTHLIKAITAVKKSYSDVKSAKLSLSAKQIELFVDQLLRIVKEEAGEAVLDRVAARFASVMISYGRGQAIPAVVTIEDGDKET